MTEFEAFGDSVAKQAGQPRHPSQHGGKDVSNSWLLA
jgi:hypothetical protein